MRKPPGYIHRRFPDQVCFLHRSFYGLRQAPRVWYEKLIFFLLAIGFKGSRIDTSLFFFRKENCLLFVLMYVDDIIVTGNFVTKIEGFISAISKHFLVKSLGKLNYFLGVEVIQNQNELWLSQKQYVLDFLR